MVHSLSHRFIRIFPGRMRIEVFGLKRNRALAHILSSQLQSCPGIKSALPCVDTGRVLIYYDPDVIAPAHIVQAIINTENITKNSILDLQTLKRPETGEVAATIDETQQVSVLNSYNYDNIQALSSIVPSAIQPYAHNNGVRQSTVPIPLALSVTGAAFLGIRQLFLGRSVLAISPALFNLSALVSVISGYPIFKRKYLSVTSKTKLNPDYLLGGAALGLALLRENIIVLAGLSLLEFMKWKKSRDPLLAREKVIIPPEIKAYCENTGRANLYTAGAAWAVTGNPLIALAVLLAGNPRIASMPSEYTWAQATVSAREKGFLIPDHTSLSELSRIRTVVLEDTSLIAPKKDSQIQCAAENDDEAEVWHLAASIMKKTNHPWKADVLTRAAEYPGTIRTAFKFVETDQGYQASIRNTEVLMGSIKFLRKNDIDCDHHLIEIKRMERKGFQVLCVAKNKQYLGCLVNQAMGLEPEIIDSFRYFQQNKVEIKALSNSLDMDEDYLASHGISIMDPNSPNTNIILIKNDGLSLPRYFRELKPAISPEKIRDLQLTMGYSYQVNSLANQNFWIAKVWNKVGVMFGIFSFLTAPIINLVGDYITLLLFSRSKHLIDNIIPIKQPSEITQLPAQNKSIKPKAGEPWHAFSAEELLKRFSVREQTGLTAEQVVILKRQYGFNQLEQKKAPPWLYSYISQFKEFTTLVVLATSLLAFLSGDMFDGLAMGSLLLVNSAIGTFQERKADKVIDALNEFQPPRSQVIRDGIQVEISGNELVPGDIICLEAGDRVPADVRLLRSWNLEVNEAALTGESLPVGKNPEALTEPCALADCKNMLYLGTDITRGKGLGLVVGTGMSTEIGYLMTLMKTQEKAVTPLHEKVTGISKTFVKIAAIAGGLVFLAGILRGRPLAQMVSTSITLAASAIPEGLPVTITIALSAGIYLMAKKNALIRKLSALETLGRATVICTDKTGTLTKNEMTVKTVATMGGLWEVSGSGYEPVGSIECVNIADHDSPLKDSNPELEYIARISLLCNNSKLEKKEDQWHVIGDPTEGALLTLAAKLGTLQDQAKHWHRVHEVPFDSNSGSMSVVCRDTKEDKDCYVFCKGSVEVVLEHCKFYQQKGEVLPLTPKMKDKIFEQNISYAREALRVLGFAYAPIEWVNENPGQIPKEMIYVGLAGMMDPPKPDIQASITEAYALGVKPVMITGDHPVTAISIAKELGISNGNSKVMTGQELDRLTDQELAELVEEINIFARVTPEHKLRIVKAFQAHGQIVAMTGDGVNDTPAIKQANIGISMGTGTEVTKAAADMVLKKDHFGSILEGITQGRIIIGNIRKAIGCLLTGNLAEIMVTATAVLAGLPMPLVPIQILLMNLLTDAIPAMILAVNPGNQNNESQTSLTKDVVDRELYSKVITRGSILASTSLGIFGVALSSGAPLAVAQTAAFVSLVVGQFVQTLSWRKEGSQEGIVHSLQDRYLIGGIGFSFLALLAAIYVPPFARFFHTAPINFKYWLSIFLTTASVSAISKLFVPLFTRVNEHSYVPGPKSLPLYGTAS